MKQRQLGEAHDGLTGPAGSPHPETRAAPGSLTPLLRAGICTTVILLAFVDWTGIFVRCQRTANESPIRDYPLALRKAGPLPTTNEFLNHEYAKVVGEIDRRLEQENQLFQYQFLLVAGVATFLFGSKILRDPDDNKPQPAWSKRGRPALLFGVAAIALLILDVHIRRNSLIIDELGYWGRVVYEQSHPAGWETYLFRASPFHSSSFMPLATGLLWLPTVVVLGAYYAVLFWQNRVDRLAETPEVGRIHRCVLVGAHGCLLAVTFMVHWPFHPGWSLSEDWLRLGIFVACVLLCCLLVFWGWGQVNGGRQLAGLPESSHGGSSAPSGASTPSPTRGKS